LIAIIRQRIRADLSNASASISVDPSESFDVVVVDVELVKLLPDFVEAKSSQHKGNLIRLI
jgi:hypothetical protein